MLRAASLALLCISSGAAALAQDGQRLRMSGETRTRYETLDGQFRPGFPDDDDDALLMRTLVLAEYEFERVTLVGELHDARAYLNDESTPISASFVNTLEVLQAHAAIQLFRNSKAPSVLKVGRMSLDIGSRRFVERNGYRNVINGYSGLHLDTRLDGGGRLDVFFVNPVRRLPRDRASLEDNEFEFDELNETREFWGIHYQKPGLFGEIQGDLFVYGLNESDKTGRDTPDRDVWAPGFRLIKRRTVGEMDFELESTLRYGSRSASSTPGSPKQDVRASMLHFEIGYTFENAWTPRIAFEYDYASGDDPSTDTYERYERFYGTRRGDLGNTSIFGPITRSNASIPGIRFTFRKDRLDGRAVVQKNMLASSQDTWIIPRLTDPTGESGRSIGTTLDWRVRYWLKPDLLRITVGGSGLWFGRFTRNVPDGPPGSRTLYGFAQVEVFF